MCQYVLLVPADLPFTFLLFSPPISVLAGGTGPVHSRRNIVRIINNLEFRRYRGVNLMILAYTCEGFFLMIANKFGKG